MDFRWDWVVDHLDDIGVAIWQHLIYVVLPLLIGFVISLGLAILAVRRPVYYGPVTAITGILYTIPSLAAFALLIPFTGLSPLTAFIPLTTYTLLILFRNIVAGFQSVPAEVIEAANGMGYRSRERLLRVEIPLALPLMFAGIRLAAVTLIGLATVVAILGSSFGGLGQLITDGLQTFFPTKYVTGGVVAVILAFIVDFLLVRLERVATPWARARAAQATPA
jgi:osmoprotectant transport system permease protein